MAATVAELSSTVTSGVTLDHAFGIRLGDDTIDVRTNHDSLHAELRGYFAPWATEPHGDADLTVTAVERDEPVLGLPFRDWQGEPGELVKEVVADLDDGRAVRKLRSGLQFLLGDGSGVVVGSDLGTRQVVRFVTLQYEGWRMARGSVLCHGAGICRGADGVALASASGGGKSTTAFHVMSSDERVAFVSNDRLLLERTPTGSVLMRGVPRHPRINPGTALDNPDLVDVVPPERRLELGAMPRDELWELDEKYELRVDAVHGRERMTSTADLRVLFLLNWRHGSPAPARVDAVDLGDRPDLIEPLMKPEGPYHLPRDGPPRTRTEPVDPARCRGVLAGVRGLELTGGVDFTRAVREVAAAMEVHG